MTRAIPAKLRPQTTQVSANATKLILVVDTAETAKRIQSAQAWIAGPESGMGKVSIRIVIAPPGVTTDEAWLFTQLAELGIIDIEALQEATIIRWST